MKQVKCELSFYKKLFFITVVIFTMDSFSNEAPKDHFKTAKAYLEKNNKLLALKNFRKSCDENKNAEGCLYAAIIEKKMFDHHSKAIEYASRGCDLDNLKACKYGVTIARAMYKENMKRLEEV